MHSAFVALLALATALSLANASTKTCPIPQKPTPGCAIEAADPVPGQVSGIAAFEYDRAARNGPSSWHNLDCKTGQFAKFRDCSYCKNSCLGEKQSPIDIIRRQAVREKPVNAPQVQFLSSADFEYEVTPGNFELRCAKKNTCGSTMFSKKKFHVENMHIHHLSEHLLDAKQYPMEMHFVHKHKQELLVVSVFFKVGRFNAQLEEFLEISRKKCHGKINVLQLVGPAIDPLNLMTYSGSRTTPPCTEGVHWAVSQHVLSASNSQIAEFNDLIANAVDSRPRQPLNGRKVTIFS